MEKRREQPSFRNAKNEWCVDEANEEGNSACGDDDVFGFIFFFFFFFFFFLVVVVGNTVIDKKFGGRSPEKGPRESCESEGESDGTGEDEENERKRRAG